MEAVSTRLSARCKRGEAKLKAETGSQKSEAQDLTPISSQMLSLSYNHLFILPYSYPTRRPPSFDFHGTLLHTSAPDQLLPRPQLAHLSSRERKIHIVTVSLPSNYLKYIYTPSKTRVTSPYFSIL